MSAGPQGIERLSGESTVKTFWQVFQSSRLNFFKLKHVKARTESVFHGFLHRSLFFHDFDTKVFNLDVSIEFFYSKTMENYISIILRNDERNHGGKKVNG